jgi:hypothetical protein
MSPAPRVFISYSHDSPTHKQWVAELATRLRRSAVDAILDQWDLSLGDDVTRFMEAGVVGSDRVLVVCTDEYVRKADAGKGGVGYERLIVTAELVQNIGTNKFIPIIRNTSGKNKTPIFLGTRLHIDFSNDEEFDEKLEELLRELHKAPAAAKPALGKNPFSITPSGEEASTSERSELIEITKQLDDPSAVYHSAVNLARSNDVYGWRQLVKRVRLPIQPSLSQWRKKYEQNPPQTVEDLHLAADEAVSIISPLLVIAMAGVESGRAEFTDQRALFDEVYELDGWGMSGLTMLVDLPYTLGYIYQALHGAVCIYTGQLELALELADMKVREKYHSEYASVWRISRIIGWPETLGGNSVTAWKFVSTGMDRWPWLRDIFGSEKDYRMSLAAYYMALNVYELATDLAERGPESYEKASLNASQIMLWVPLSFVDEAPEIQRRALALLVGKKRSVRALWERRGVSRADIERVWPNWVETCKAVAAYSKGPSYWSRFMNLGHADLFKLLEESSA